MPQIGIPAAMLISSAVGGGAALASSAMNRGTANKALQQQSQQNYTTNMLGQEAAQRSKPAYDSAYNYYRRMLDGDMSSLQPDIQNTQQQFAQASSNVLQNSQARGGGLSRALGQVEAAKAMSISDIMSRARPQAANALAALASGDQQAALQSLAAAQAGKLGQQQLSQEAYSGVGSFITRFLSTPGLFSSFGKGNQGGQPGARFQFPQAFINATGTNPWGSLPTGNDAGFSGFEKTPMNTYYPGGFVPTWGK